jgi:hypothetical protein
MDVKLTAEQREFVDQYNTILNRLHDIQSNIDKLKKEADEAILALNQLRHKEQQLFPDNKETI